MTQEYFAPGAFWCLLKNLNSDEVEVLAAFYENGKAMILYSDFHLAEAEAEKSIGYMPYCLETRDEAIDILLGAITAGVTHVSIDPGKHSNITPIAEAIRAIQEKR